MFPSTGGILVNVNILLIRKLKLAAILYLMKKSLWCQWSVLKSSKYVYIMVWINMVQMQGLRPIYNGIGEWVTSQCEFPGIPPPPCAYPGDSKIWENVLSESPLWVKSSLS